MDRRKHGIGGPESSQSGLGEVVASPDASSTRSQSSQGPAGQCWHEALSRAADNPTTRRFAVVICTGPRWILDVHSWTSSLWARRTGDLSTN